MKVSGYVAALFYTVIILHYHNSKWIGVALSFTLIGQLYTD